MAGAVAAVAEEEGGAATRLDLTGSQLLLALVMLATILRPLVLPERFARRAQG